VSSAEESSTSCLNMQGCINEWYDREIACSSVQCILQFLSSVNPTRNTPLQVSYTQYFIATLIQPVTSSYKLYSPLLIQPIHHRSLLLRFPICILIPFFLAHTRVQWFTTIYWVLLIVVGMKQPKITRLLSDAPFRGPIHVLSICPGIYVDRLILGIIGYVRCWLRMNTSALLIPVLKVV
jgi:hypothetical protein